ncbi:MAG: hypothetical protein H6737_17250 [Alphaproteobacteria bacterium]|nr:hypothetical protein [Alphaproteobacteria bacterium]
MPPRATHRLDLHLVPGDLSEAAAEAVEALWRAWEAQGYLAGRGPGERAGALVEGGFAHARRDDPGAVVLYANQVGGFQVRCPECGSGLARSLDWAGTTVCPSCGGAFALEALDCRPPVARGRASLVLMDVGSTAIAEIPPGWRVVMRRVG